MKKTRERREEENKGRFEKSFRKIQQPISNAKERWIDGKIDMINQTEELIERKIR